MKIVSLLLLLCTSLSAMAAMPGYPVETITYAVKDTNGVPVEGALVEVAWHSGGRDWEWDKETTNGIGEISFTRAIHSYLYVRVTKDGYYETSGDLWNGGYNQKVAWEMKGSRYYEDMRHGNLVKGRPPAVFEIVLKKIIDPVPMYHKVFKGDIPKLNEPVGFDLEKGDWVMPYGEGSHEDLIFTAEKRFAARRDFDEKVTLSFSNESDGIQDYYGEPPTSIKLKSTFPAPQIAPVEGYRNENVFEESRRPGEPMKSYEKDDRHYLIRVRSEVDQDGIITRANYARTVGEIHFDPINFETVWIKFEYYYNPDPESRSLEYNGENLFEE